MDNGIRILGNTMRYLQDKIDVSSNNLSNIDTPGYKKDIVVGRAFNHILSDEMAHTVTRAYNQGMIRFEPGVYVDEIYTQFSQGGLQETNRPWDVAIQGNGFFVVESDIGPLYRRSMSMKTDMTGILTTDTGNPVMGQNGTIFIGDNDFTIEYNGTIRIDGEVVDQLNVVDFANPDQLQRGGNGGFMNAGAGFIPAQGDVLQGYLESSNVDLSEEMTNLIEINNRFTTSQRLIQMLDEISGIGANRLGKV